MTHQARSNRGSSSGVDDVLKKERKSHGYETVDIMPGCRGTGDLKAKDVNGCNKCPIFSVVVNINIYHGSCFVFPTSPPLPAYLCVCALWLFILLPLVPGNLHTCISLSSSAAVQELRSDLHSSPDCSTISSDCQRQRLVSLLICERQCVLFVS